MQAPERSSIKASAVWITLAIMGVLWVAAIATFFQSVLRPVPDARFVSDGHRSILIGLKGIQGNGASAFDVYDVPAGAIVLGSLNGHAKGSSSVTWTLNTHTISRFASNSRDLVSYVAIQSPIDPFDYQRNGRVVVSINGTERANVALTRFVPTGLSPTHHRQFIPVAGAMKYMPIPFAADYLVPCAVFKLTKADLQHDTLAVTVSTRSHSEWNIASIQLYTQFMPVNSPLLRNRTINAIAGVAILASIVVLAVFSMLAFWRRARWVGLFAALATFAVAILSRDPWDLPVWSQLLDITAFGGGSPAYAWTGTPLWSFVPGVLAPVLTWCNDLFGIVPPALNIVLLKSALWLAFVSVAIQLSDLAPAAWKRVVLIIWTISPFSLFLCSWGVRDLLSTAIALYGLRLLMKGRIVFAVLLLAMAGSIDEYYAPVLVLPAVVYLLTSKRTIFSVVSAALIAALPYALIIAQWLAVGPRYASSVMDYRLGVTYMDCTWQFLLLSAGLLPGIFLDHESALFAALYLLIAIPFLWRLRRLLFSAQTYTAEEAFQGALAPIVACVGAFFLSYGQADHQEWFGLMMLVQVVAFRMRALAPVVGLFLLVAGLELYSHVGLREFLNPAYFNLQYVGLWQIRGAVDRILIGTCLALIVLVLSYIASKGKLRLFGEQSCYIIPIWFGALLSVITGMIGNDLVLMGFATITLLALCLELTPISRQKSPSYAAILVPAAILLILLSAPHWALIALLIGGIPAAFTVPALRSYMLRAYTSIDAILLTSAFALVVAPMGKIDLTAYPSGAVVIWLLLVSAVFFLVLAVPRHARAVLSIIGLGADKLSAVPDRKPAYSEVADA